MTTFITQIIHLKKFVETNGHAKVSATYRCDDDFFLGKWVSHRREDFKNGKLSQKYIPFVVKCFI